jgi:predicted nucleic acid-binding protein
MTFVLDASMAVSFVLSDEYGAKSKRTLAAVAEQGAVVPTLWDFEVVNSLTSAERRGRLTPAALTNALNGLSRLPISRDHRPVDHGRLASVAREFAISGYDAAYLSLALDDNLPLATLDDRLIHAATKAGVHLTR